jgi:hypothetical protein
MAVHVTGRKRWRVPVLVPGGASLFGGSLRSGRPACLVEHRVDRQGEAGSLVPALEHPLCAALHGDDLLEPRAGHRAEACGGTYWRKTIARR